uniref:Flagellar basal-body rod protein FlgF n=1 Tax=uncultured Armatimonadetes bacterium TaxID=157466 RepID=A0A6J4I176_9BACT|nr:Flagellar basal-body rod protein FlgF [uncultured Armatimonadetes bacterium]
MLRGVYTAASAMLAQETAQSVIANNLANAATPGFKGDVAAFEAFRLAALTRAEGGSQSGSLGTLGAGAATAEIALDLSDGPLQQTGNPLNVALRGSAAFFVVRTPQGDRLTRAGEFAVGPDGTLTDTGGHPVLDRSGRAIRAGQGSAEIDAEGNLLVDKRVAASLQVVALLPGVEPRKEGHRLLRVDAGGYRPVDRPRLVTGALEASNVSVVEEMVSMIAAMRSYEAAAKALQSEDEALGRALNEVAKA